MLASAADEVPQGTGWLYEFKWDGVRALLEITGGRMTLRSRRGNDITVAYPELGTLGRGIDDARVDGEIVAFVDGRPSFVALQSRMHVRSRSQARELATQVPVTYIAFDVLRLYGVDVTARPLDERRATLIRLAEDRPGWTVSPAFDDGTATEAAAREHGLEGVVAKRMTSRYRPGVRGPDWVKVRFMYHQEFVVVGWESDAQRPEVLSSLVLGYADDGGWGFAGKVGSGLSAPESRALQRRLVPTAAPVLVEQPPPSPGRVVTWVQPDVVVEVSYSEWAPDGRLRQPVYVGIRTDKPANEVTRDA